MPVKPAKAKKTTVAKKTTTSKTTKDMVGVKKSSKGQNMVDLRQPTKKVAPEPVRNILTVHKKSEAITKLEEMPKFEIRHEAGKESLVRHFDMDEKIDFKHLHNKPLHIYRKISLFFIILTLLLLSAMAYFSLVKVDISLVLNKEQVKGDFVVGVANDAQTSSSSQVIAGAVKEVTVEQTKEFEATGKQILGADVNGTVKIVNNYVRNQPLVANTRLLTSDNQVVHLKTTVNVPAGGSVEVAVFSADATSSINIPVNSRLTIPGLWQGIQDKIYAESLTPITYQEKFKKIVSADDISGAEIAMKQELENKIKTDIIPTYQGQYSKVLYKIEDETLVSTVDAKQGEVKDYYNARGTVKVLVVAFSDQAVVKLAQDQLIGQLTANKVLITFDQAALTYELGNYDAVAGSASVNVGFAGTVMAKDQALVDKSRLLGLTASQLENYLKSLPEIGSYQIRFTPGFIGRVPYLINRINVNVVSN
jgi:hypothetical protein